MFALIFLVGYLFFKTQIQSEDQIQGNSQIQIDKTNPNSNKNSNKKNNLKSPSNDLALNKNLKTHTDSIIKGYRFTAEPLAQEVSSLKNPLAMLASAKLLPEVPDGAVSFIIEDGLFVTQGDMIVGEVPKDTLLKSLTGYVKEPVLKLWPTHEIPVFISPMVSRPERVHEAISYFSQTNIRFVNFADQADAIAILPGKENCISYMGYLGGHQPIYIAEGCSADNIAHELMHAIGFIHEQNRMDRDSYIEVLFSNIDSKYHINFEKFSNDLMRVSGLTEFDFESLMLYPETMFSNNGSAAIKSRIKEERIRPLRTLSPKDIYRVNLAYPN